MVRCRIGRPRRTRCWLSCHWIEKEIVFTDNRQTPNLLGAISSGADQLCKPEPARVQMIPSTNHRVGMDNLGSLREGPSGIRNDNGIFGITERVRGGANPLFYLAPASSVNRQHRNHVNSRRPSCWLDPRLCG